MRQVVCACAVVVMWVVAAAAFAAEAGEIEVQPVAGGGWTISAPGRTVRLRGDFSVKIDAGAATWELLASGADDLLLQAGGETFAARFGDAKAIDIQDYNDGVKRGVSVDLADFRRAGRHLDLRVRLIVAIEAASGDVIFDVAAAEGDASVRECRWPKAVEPKDVDATVIPFMQGVLLPREWGKKVTSYDPMSYGRGLYMPWWGQMRGESAAMVILETPSDGGYELDHPAGGPTKIATRWVHSLGKLAYPRRARMCFIDRGGYVEMAKRYREYVKESGNFVSLKEKIARESRVERLLGSPIIHTGILYHTQPGSNYFDKDDPKKNHQLVTFDEKSAALKKLSERGVGRAYVHVDGWGFRGYDNLHPDVLPPCPEAGGWDGMKRLGETLHSLGYLFAVHDNYRDYYRDAASFDEALAVQNEDGSHPSGHDWPGGEESILCSRLAAGHVEKNHRALMEHGIKLDGTYLDVFSVVPGDECYNTMHPATRAESLRFRGECFNLIRALEGIVSSEEPTDWSIPYLDLCHHAPFALDPNPGGGPAIGVPIPLFNLVYHDAIFIPWTMSKGGWGIPSGDSGYLHCLANGGLPYLSEAAGDEEIARVRIASALAKRVGLAEMIRHEFLDDSRRRQRTSFAEGTRVTVDFEKDQFEISPALSREELEGALARSR